MVPPLTVYIRYLLYTPSALKGRGKEPGRGITQLRIQILAGHLRTCACHLVRSSAVSICNVFAGVAQKTATTGPATSPGRPLPHE